LPFLVGWGVNIPEKDGIVEMDLESLVGRSALLTVVHNTVEATGKTYANIGNATELPKAMTALEVENVEYKAPEFIKKMSDNQVVDA